MLTHEEPATDNREQNRLLGELHDHDHHCRTQSKIKNANFADIDSNDSNLSNTSRESPSIPFAQT